MRPIVRRQQRGRMAEQSRQGTRCQSLGLRCSGNRRDPAWRPPAKDCSRPGNRRSALGSQTFQWFRDAFREAANVRARGRGRYITAKGNKLINILWNTPVAGNDRGVDARRAGQIQRIARVGSEPGAGSNRGALTKRDKCPIALSDLPGFPGHAQDFSASIVTLAAI